MSNRPGVMRLRAVLRGYETRTRPRRSPFQCPLGDWGHVSTFGPALSNGTENSVELAADPGAWRGVGKCAGVNDKVDRLRRSSIDRAATKRSRRPLVGRFRDMIVNDVGGVSALQHSAKAIED